MRTALQQLRSARRGQPSGRSTRAKPMSRPNRSAAADFMRLVATYLCLVLLMQGLAAAMALGAGPSHHHRQHQQKQKQQQQADGAGQSVPALLFSQHRFSPDAPLHDLQHQTGTRHHHGADDATVIAMPSLDTELDRAATALTVAMSLLALGGTFCLRDMLRHVWRAAPAWARCTAVLPLPYKPPRAG